MDPLTELLVAVRDELQDVARGQLVFTACSGGPDSLALAAATARLAPARGWRTGAVVIDHGWSAEASAAGQQAADVLRELGLDPVELIRVAPGTGGLGPEAAARAARYQALDEAAERLGAAAVLLGHTLDDQAETVLLGLGRGSGARSLAGMARRRGAYRRPLLGLRRAVTLAACQAMELQPWYDPANQDDRFTRVRVRQLASALEAALGPGTATNLAKTADLLREDADALDAAAQQLLQKACIRQARIQQARTTSAEVDAEVLAAAPAAIRRRALLAAAREATGATAISRAHVLALDALLAANDGAQTNLPSGVVARLVCGRLRFASSPLPADQPRP